MGHPGIAEAAVIGRSHPKWSERPLLIVVRKPNVQPPVSETDIVNWLATRVAKWWVPDNVEFVDSLPHTATGKLLKTQLRKQFDKYQWRPLPHTAAHFTPTAKL
jgi:fatty-acyl-CoA synthase